MHSESYYKNHHDCFYRDYITFTFLSLFRACLGAMIVEDIGAPGILAPKEPLWST
jgi:hypothetical protein